MSITLYEFLGNEDLLEETRQYHGLYCDIAQFSNIISFRCNSKLPRCVLPPLRSTSHSFPTAVLTTADAQPSSQKSANPLSVANSTVARLGTGQLRIVIIYRNGKEVIVFSSVSEPALQPTSPPTERKRVGVSRGHESNHPPPSSVEFK